MITAGAAALARLGVRRVFGAGGDLAAETAAFEVAGVTLVETRTASAAVIMAAVAGDLEDVPGVVLFGGHGSLQGARAALHQARRDRSPVIVLTAGPAPLEAPELSIGTAIKATVRSLGDAASLALAAPRGPVRVQFQALPDAGDQEWRTPGRSPSTEELDQAARVLGASVRPVVLVGLEARSPDDAEWVRAFAEALPAPVVTTSKGRGVLPEPHPLALGVLDGPGAAVLERADLIVALGVDPDELGDVEWRPAVPVLQVTRSAARCPATAPGAQPSCALGSPAWTTGLAIVADIALVLEELAPRLRDAARADWDVAELHRVKRGVVGHRPRPVESRSEEAALEARAAHAVALARELTPPRSIAVFERRWTGITSAWPCVTPGDLLYPTPPGLCGFGVPAALAAALVRPGAPVVAFVDAEGLAASWPELATGRRLGLAPAIVVLGDARAPLLARVEALGVPVVAGPGEAALAGCLAGVAGRRVPVVVRYEGGETARPV